MKKTTKVLLTAMAMSAIMSAQALAAEWLVDPTPYSWGVLDHKWQDAETEAQMEKWVNERKDAIIALPTEREKVDACIKAVCDFYTYDIRSDNVHPYYAYTTGYGVCKDYARDFHALLDVAGIENIEVFGWLNDVEHSWNKAKVDGVWYYFDLPSVDTTTIPDSFKYQIALGSEYVEGLEKSAGYFRGDIYKEDGGSRENVYAWPEGMEPVVSRSGKTVYITKEDGDKWDNGILSTDEIKAKYPELNN